MARNLIEEDFKGTRTTNINDTDYYKPVLGFEDTHVVGRNGVVFNKITNRNIFGSRIGNRIRISLCVNGKTTFRYLDDIMRDLMMHVDITDIHDYASIIDDVYYDDISTYREVRLSESSVTHSLYDGVIEETIIGKTLRSID